MSQKRMWFLGMLALFALVVSPARALADTVIFNNLGPGNTFGSAAAWGVGGPTSSFGFVSVGISFTPSVSLDLSQVLLPLELVSGTNSVEVSVYSDSTGLPGTALESWSVTGLGAAALQDLTDTSNLLLSAGTPYWVVAAAGGSDTFAGWNFNNTTTGGILAGGNGSVWHAFNETGQSCNGAPCAQPALEVLGVTPVPEPTSFLVLGTGLLGLGALRRSKKFRLRRSGGPYIPIARRPRVSPISSR
jgi:hypothetical protein